MKNIIFIGMPGSGKTTVSKRVAKALGMPWFDSDIEIEAMEGMSISDIFAQKGEEYFRACETRCIGRLTEPGGAVIAVGGGAVLRNGELLKHNSTVVYLRRSVENILSTLEGDTRPLLRDRGNLLVLYNQRRAIYEEMCDITVDNDGAASEAADKVLEALK